MLRRRWALVVSLVASGCAHAPVKPPPVEDVVAEAHREVAERVRKGGWPDLAVGVVINGKLVYAEGFGQRDPTSPDPVTTHTLFRIASLTKLFTGMAILQLRDAGKLDLDDPVSKYIPEIDGVVYPTSEHPQIRIRHLVTHTSGLPHDGNQFGGTTDAELLGQLNGLTLEFTPGSAESYSNLGMSIAGLVIVRASGQPYKDYMREHILEPLGMNESVWERSEAKVPVAQGMRWSKDGQRYVPIKKELVAGTLEPAGGMYSNVADLARFVAFEMSAWPPSNAPEQPPLSRSSLRESQLTAGPLVPSRIQPGVNWFVQDNRSYGMLDHHMGRLEGYHSEIIILPKAGVGVIALGCQARTDEQFDDMAASLLAAVAPLRRPEEPIPLGITLQTAIARLVDWLKNPALDGTNSVFSPEMIEADDHLLSDTRAALTRNGGQCSVAKISPDSFTHATVQLKCAHDDWTSTVRMQPSPPHLVDGWRWE
jgi:CubicO group peptidase (beta-lactamase class C family)